MFSSFYYVFSHILHNFSHNIPTVVHCKTTLILILTYLLAQKGARRQPLFKKKHFIFNATFFISGQFISKAVLAKCQALTGTKCHEHYQATHLDAIF